MGENEDERFSCFPTIEEQLKCNPKFFKDFCTLFVLLEMEIKLREIKEGK